MLRSKLIEFASRKGFLLPRDTSWHAAFVGQIAKVTRPKAYLEVGVYRGETFREVAKWAERSVGVDIDPEAGRAISGVRRSSFVLGALTSNILSEIQKLGPYDLVFIDADHSKESVVSDFDRSQQMLSSNGLILLHDTWPKNKDFTKPEFCGDAWLAVELLRSKYPLWSFVTIPAHPGLTICQQNTSLPF
jgi:predicted O-methyltransferase YrrM